jgi:hypothetical protein
VKIFYFICGALIPLPIFFDLNSGELMLKKFTEMGYLERLGVPIPIGLFAFICLVSPRCLILFANKIKNLHSGAHCINLNILLSVVFFLTFVVYAFASLESKRLVSLLVPHFAILGFYTIYSHDLIKKFTLMGFVFSLYAFIFVHAMSILFFRFIMEIDNSHILFGSLFDFVIYQSYVSYSALLSFLYCVLFIMVYIRDRRYYSLYYFLLIFVILFVLGHGARKAVLLDAVFLVFTISLFAICQFFGRLSVSRKYLIYMSLFCFAIGALIFLSDFTDRRLTVDAALDQRGDAYFTFILILQNSNVAQLLFGHSGDWGGFSNLFVELFVRLGIVGLALYLSSLYFPIRFVARELSVYFKQTLTIFSDFSKNLKIFFVFVFLSVFGSNIINMNLQLPYYVINVTLIVIFFVFKEHQKDATWSVNRHGTYER